jgi:hypothetical protein
MVTTVMELRRTQRNSGTREPPKIPTRACVSPLNADSRARTCLQRCRFQIPTCFSKPCLDLIPVLPYSHKRASNCAHGTLLTLRPMFGLPHEKQGMVPSLQLRRSVTALLQQDAGRGCSSRPSVRLVALVSLSVFPKRFNSSEAGTPILQ